jgi:hypothetical protein
VIGHDNILQTRLLIVGQVERHVAAIDNNNPSLRPSINLLVFVFQSASSGMFV